MATFGAIPEGIYAAHALEKRQGVGFSAVDYPEMSEVMNMALISLSVRFPEVGCVRNTKSEMLVLITLGKIEFWVKPNSVGNIWVQSTVTRGMQVLVPKGSWYYWKPIRATSMVVCSSPPWKKEDQEFYMEPV